MYVRIRASIFKLGEPDRVIEISKKARIAELQKLIFEELGVEAEDQRLFYRGKQLIPEHRVIDYDINLNDVIQLMIRPGSSNTKYSEPVKEDLNTPSTSSKSDERQDGESEYYKIGDLVDYLEPEQVAWFEGVIVNIFWTNQPTGDIDDTNNIEPCVIFKVKSVADNGFVELSFHEMRPRAYYLYNFEELFIGQTLMANYNLEDPNSRGYWYDYTLTKITRTFIQGTITLRNSSKKTYQDRTVRLLHELYRIEDPVLLSKKAATNHAIPLRKTAYICDKCEDLPNKKCKHCGCKVCRSKHNASSIIICDDCDAGYHIKCLDPPLDAIPEDDEWYCPNCKLDASEIVQAGDKLKYSKKKSKLVSNKKTSGKKTNGKKTNGTKGSGKKGSSKKPKGKKRRRDWGRGMATIGRMSECNIVPKHHFGPVPGVEVGSCWRYRLQAGDAGIHRPHIAGIHGTETRGAFSICLSGGYVDDVDNGLEFIYSGSGGRDLSGNKRVNKQSKHQKLTRMNKALAINCDAPVNVEGAVAENWQKGKPIRVLRNHKLKKISNYAPPEGNRYDGIYKIVSYKREKGKRGFFVYKYVFRRDDPIPAPWEEGGQMLPMIYPDGYLEAQRRKAAKLEAAKKERAEAAAARRQAAAARRQAAAARRRTNSAAAAAKHSAKSSNSNKRIVPDSSESSTNAESGDSYQSKRPRTETVTSAVAMEAIHPIPNIVKVQPYKPDDDLTKYIDDDTVNQKKWAECKDVMDAGTKIFMEKVREVFMCICCQEILNLPITLECTHNICKACLKRSFASMIYKCPYCRLELAEDFTMNVNDALQSALLKLFPAYNCGRH